MWNSVTTQHFKVEGDGFSNGNTLTLLPSGEIISAGEFQGNMFLENDSIKTGTADEDVFFAKFQWNSITFSPPLSDFE